jgi:hypothetical protein
MSGGNDHLPVARRIDLPVSCRNMVSELEIRRNRPHGRRIRVDGAMLALENSAMLDRNFAVECLFGYRNG